MANKRSKNNGISKMRNIITHNLAIIIALLSMLSKLSICYGGQDEVKLVVEEEANLLLDSITNSIETTPDSAKMFINRAIYLSEQSNNDTLTAKFIELNGYYFYKVYAFDTAQIEYQKALDIYEKTNHKPGISSVYNELGKIYLLIGDAPKANEYFSKSLDYAEDELSKAKRRVNIGSTYLNQGELAKAMELYLISMQFYERHNLNNLLFTVLLNISVVQHKSKQYQKSIAYCERAIALKDSINYGEKRVLKAYIGMAASYRRLKQYKNAKQILNDISIESLHDKDYNDFGLLAYQKGLLEYEMKEYGEAIDLFNASLNWAKKANNLSSKGEIYFMLGLISKEQNNYTKAIYLFNQSLKISHSCSENASVLRSLEMLIPLYKQTNNYKLACELQEEYYTIKRKYDIENQAKELQISEAKVLLHQQQRNIEKLTEKNREKELVIEKSRYQYAFFLICLSLSGIITYLIFKLKYLNRNKELENININIENKLLRTQLNPHFLFNSLNSVQAYISDSKTKEASIFLADFAQLMRLILQSTYNDLIPLSEELRLLELFLKIQQRCLNYKFDYEIDVDSQINTDAIHVPPFIAQPFVENAIKHGINPIKHKGLISVKYYMLSGEEVMCCEVYDNGAGVNKQGVDANKANNGFGMRLIQERLKIYQKDYKHKLEVKLYSGNNNKGALAKINFPYFPNNI